MIKQQLMSPAVALYHWRVHGMSMAQVLSHTGYVRWSDLAADHDEALANEETAQQDMLMSPEERQREEDVEAVWQQFGDYLREMVPPPEYDDEIERLLPLIKKTRQMQNAARSKPFRDAIKRRRQYQ
ncbi:hypothetical protein ELI02_02050 [Rhizobium leguminosarum]|uniref:hypothetical protein n=1 Tax=Rhizobium leguminosarum TaxID=384 RepID=UPI0010320AD4|nr:hypothetical protein [Rhizobium leguminosarum]TAX58902.1 hypothetical protein ELI02_02050 [Rhizobium leguminosarum]